MYRAGAFARFDYGSTVENIKHYNSTMPPHYAVSKFPTFVPLCLVYGGEDYLADPTDVKNLIGRLPTVRIPSVALVKV
jgi:lysosomal acid lipase/cholesteryl ester hydrolase